MGFILFCVLIKCYCVFGDELIILFDEVYVCWVDKLDFKCWVLVINRVNEGNVIEFMVIVLFELIYVYWLYFG